MWIVPLVNSPHAPICVEFIITDSFREVVMTEILLADVVTRTLYFSLPGAVFVLVFMLLLTGLPS
jgi:hypothetical protein